MKQVCKETLSEICTFNRGKVCTFISALLAPISVVSSAVAIFTIVVSVVVGNELLPEYWTSVMVSSYICAVVSVFFCKVVTKMS